MGYHLARKKEEITDAYDVGESPGQYLGQEKPEYRLYVSTYRENESVVREVRIVVICRGGVAGKGVAFWSSGNALYVFLSGGAL